ncbi:two-component system sensor histidine kinase NtrB [Aestuariibius sp. 2305UL40-4]|uniref:two-component system sensor histidine kinase NtrB n=1 Tax=Aestuariibius violaceus TaxID=3234132 RepID=UPI00345ECC33
MNGEDLWASLPVPAVLLEQGNAIADVNGAAEDFFNQSRKGLKGKPLFQYLLVDTDFTQAIARARDSMASLHINDIDVGAPGRAPMQCNIRVAPLQNGDGRMILLCAPREITSFLSGRASAVTAVKSAVGMAEMLAHEIKNPLAGITGAAQLLSMNLTNGDRELTDLIVAESRRIVKLLDQVEQFGNLRPPASHVVNIHDVLDRARRSATVGFGAHMNIEEDYDPSLPPTWADADMLQQVFLNLLKNASEAQPKGGTIRLRTFFDLSLRMRRQDGSAAKLPLQIEIIDDGPGIPPDIADSLFDPFVSGKENGTGLGLALVSKIVTDHGGWISVDSHPGRTVFRISLPIAPKGSAAP